MTRLRSGSILTKLRSTFLKGRCPHKDTKAVAEGSTDEDGCKRVAVEHIECGVSLAVAERPQARIGRRVVKLSRQGAKVMQSKTRCMVGSRKMVGGSRKTNEGRLEQQRQLPFPRTLVAPRKTASARARYP